MKTGIHDAIPAAVYHADPCEQPSLNSHIAVILINQSPRHAWFAHPRLNPDYRREPEERFNVGTVAHALLLEGEDVCGIVPYPDYRKQDAKDARDAIRAQGRIPLLAAQWDDVVAMVEAFRAQFDMPTGKPEQTLIWKETHGDLTIGCRARVDWLYQGPGIVDYKTTKYSANPKDWTKRTLYSIGADVQAAFYLRGLAVLGHHDARLRYVVQETFPPYVASVIELGPDVLDFGAAKVDLAIETWCKCIQSGYWPGYSDRTAVAALPAWAENDWLALEEAS